MSSIKNRAYLSRIRKKRVLFSGTWSDGGGWETLGTRKDWRSKYSGFHWSKSKRTSFYKKQSNKVFRREMNISSGNNYRKAFDYKRTID